MGQFCFKTSFLEYKAIQALYPEMEAVISFEIFENLLVPKIEPNDLLKEKYFKSEFLLELMYEDAFTGSHPIELDVLTSNEALAVFDTITYDKGCAILKMLESIVGQENMKQAFRVNFFTLALYWCKNL